jgi:hypothetical protein
MDNSYFKNYFSDTMIQNQINFLFTSFIFLFSLKYDFFQIRFLILVLLIPCGINIIRDCINKNFKNLVLLSSFFIMIAAHSFINIYYENTGFTSYNLFGIFFITFVFVISFFYYENFNKNILKIIKLFLIIFFISVLLSLLNFKNDAPFFCGGIPDIFGFLKSYEQYLPDGTLKGLSILDSDRIGDMKFSFKEYLFPENSHLGMIAPSIIIYLIYLNFTKESNFLTKFLTIFFLIICLIKSSTTLLVGTIISAIILLIFNFRYLTKNTLIAYSGLIIIFTLILFSSQECRSRFVPIYSPTNNLENSQDINNIETVGGINKKFAINLQQIMQTSGNLSSGVYFKALSIAKHSIVEKPFGWGLNRYDKAFEYFIKKQPSKNHSLNSYNNKDGTNNFVKLIVEFGIFALFVYLFIFFFLISKKIPIELKLFYLPIVITQSLRGAGYFNGGFSLIIFLMLFTYLNSNIKKL